MTVAGERMQYINLKGRDFDTVLSEESWYSGA